MTNIKKEIISSLILIFIIILIFNIGYFIGKGNGIVKGISNGFNKGFSKGIYYERSNDQFHKLFIESLYKEAYKYYLDRNILNDSTTIIINNTKLIKK